MSALDSNKCFTQIKQQRLLLRCAPITELPSNLSTMGICGTIMIFSYLKNSAEFFLEHCTIFQLSSTLNFIFLCCFLLHSTLYTFILYPSFSYTIPFVFIFISIALIGLSFPLNCFCKPLILLVLQCDPSPFRRTDITLL